MVYAPVLIPTLNRYEHLKRLIESLQKNKFAEFTELYIGVDFPPKESYREGYEKVCEYLKSGISGFKKVNLFFHKSNLGSSGNVAFLKKQIAEKYDRFIFTEDDNEFSPNFLQYIDEGMKRYSDDNNVIAICGHAYDLNWEIPEDKLVKINCMYDGWGMGRWFKKDKELYGRIDLVYLEGILKNIKRAFKLYHTNHFLFARCVETVVRHRGYMFYENGEFRAIDTAVCIYMIDQNQVTINPILSKVRNWGDDGSGLHGGNERKGHKQPIDSNLYFSFPKDEDIIQSELIQQKLQKYLSCTVVEDIKALILWSIYYVHTRIMLVKEKWFGTKK